ncbi:MULTISPECIES: ABC transporter permease [Clostridium]|uniref:ABC transporter permease n=1 Tax=Clostridium TaxID=1485 RepID=UPI00069D486C|nr:MULTISPECIES: ABC transporter permease [Clostridium]KOF57127.1 ABC transporter permease [Clostridium sp. DMHC 10]MCD2347360.1 ABC transporter permease [Clostridium guangxiense]
MKKLKGLILPVILILVWAIISKLHIVNEYIIPSPEKVFLATLEMIKSGELAKNMIISLGRVIAGFIITFIISFPMAIFIGAKPKAIPYVEPFMEFMRHVPPIATIPILILWFGIGEASKLFVIFLATFFPIFSNTLNGITNHDKKLLEVGDSLGFTNRDKFLKIIFPQAIPSIMTGVQLGLGYSWRSLMGAELIAASSGIGYMIVDAEQLSRPDVVIVGILSIGILGYVIDYVLIKITERLINKYGKEIDYGGVDS